MINIDKVKLLYSKVISLDDIRTKDIRDAGLNKHDITTFLKYNILKRVARGHYELVDFDSLLIYSNQLLEMGKTEEFIKVLKCCLKIDPDNQLIYTKLFYTYIRNRKYEEALEYFEFLYQDKSNLIINNIYLYLLSFLTDLPNEYKEVVFNMTKDDFNDFQSSSLLNQSKLYNQALIAIYYSKFFKAIDKLSKIKGEGKEIPINNAIMIKLLYLIIAKKKEIYKEIEILIKEKRYDELWNYLNNILLSRPLSRVEEAIYSMLLHYFKMYATKEIPKKKDAGKDDKYFLDTILNCEYDHAYMLYQEYKTSKEDNVPKNDLFLPLLEEILKEKDKIRKMDNYISKIITMIKSSSIDEVIPLIKEFLEYCNNSNYLYLVICYAKISLLESDKEFKGLEDILKKLKSPYFKIDLYYYISLYKDALMNKEYEISQIYLDIIRRNTDDSILIASLNSGKDMDNEEAIYEKINPDIIKEKVAEAKSDGIAIFPIMAEDELTLAKKMITLIPEIHYFTVANEFGKRIVFKYSPKMEDGFNYREINFKVEQARKKKNYDEALRLNKELLEFYYVPSTHILAGIGVSYYHLGNYPLAYKYFVASDGIVYKYYNHHSQGYLKMINIINIVLDNESIPNYYEEAVNLLKNGKGIEEIISTGHYDDSDISYIYLAYVKECYTNEDYKTGDEYLYKVASINSNNGIRAKLLSEIRKNKTLYKDRNNNGPKRELTK